MKRKIKFTIVILVIAIISAGALIGQYNIKSEAQPTVKKKEQESFVTIVDSNPLTVSTKSASLC